MWDRSTVDVINALFPESVKVKEDNSGLLERIEELSKSSVSVLSLLQINSCTYILCDF